MMPAPARSFLSRPLYFCASASRAGGRAAKERFSAVGKRDANADALVLAAFGLITVDDNFRSDRQGVLCHAMPDQVVRAAAFDPPSRHRAVRTLHVDPEPRMGIHQFHF